MNLFRFASLIFLFSVTPSALASECGLPISIYKIAELKGTITLGGLTAKFGEWCQGHDPVNTYKDTNGNEFWFFWKATNQAATSDAERMKYQVLIASVVPANDPGDYQIIWPPEFVGKEIRDILTKEYDSPKNIIAEHDESLMIRLRNIICKAMKPSLGGNSLYREKRFLLQRLVSI